MSQIFKQPVPTEKLMKLLENISQKHSKHYLFDNAAYKKGILNNLIPEFMSECSPYYHVAKQSYLEKKMSYTTFTTVLRQICKFNDIKFTSQIKYDKSIYNIDYYVYFDV